MWCFAGLELGSLPDEQGYKPSVLYCPRELQDGSLEASPHLVVRKHTKSHPEPGDPEAAHLRCKDVSVTWLITLLAAMILSPLPLVFKVWRSTGLAWSLGNGPGHPLCLLFLLPEVGEQVCVAHLLVEQTGTGAPEESNALATLWAAPVLGLICPQCPQPFLCHAFMGSGHPSCTQTGSPPSPCLCRGASGCLN